MGGPAITAAALPRPPRLVAEVGCEADGADRRSADRCAVVVARRRGSPRSLPAWWGGSTDRGIEPLGRPGLRALAGPPGAPVRRVAPHRADEVFLASDGLAVLADLHHGLLLALGLGERTSRRPEHADREQHRDHDPRRPGHPRMGCPARARVELDDAGHVEADLARPGGAALVDVGKRRVSCVWRDSRRSCRSTPRPTPR